MAVSIFLRVNECNEKMSVRGYVGRVQLMKMHGFHTYFPGRFYVVQTLLLNVWMAALSTVTPMHGYVIHTDPTWNTYVDISAAKL